MDGRSNQDHAVELLKELGLKAYEAESFVALSRITDGTAQNISDISEVPRTRVYDAVTELESKGLVEIQHSNPQRFRAVSIDEAVETIQGEFDQRLESLRQYGSAIEPASVDTGDDDTHEVWTMGGGQAITENRGESPGVYSWDESGKSRHEPRAIAGPSLHR